VGIVAISYAAGPAILAAMRPDTRETVGFVYAMGPYYDIEAVVTYLTTGYFRQNQNDPWQQQEPSGYAKWVFVHSNAARLENASDRSTLTAMALRKIDDPLADISDLAAKLGPEGRAVYDLLGNTDPERTADLIADLPASLRADFAGLDLSSKNFADLSARLILVHGREDKLIPYTESQALAAAAGDEAHLFVLNSLEHIELELSGVADLNKTWRAAYLLLRERDAAPPPQGLEAQSSN
jgi:pimeloyl-ACP methyl ester carboxylesterase